MSGPVPKSCADAQLHQGCVIWITGLSGSGKNQLARALRSRLHSEGVLTYVLDEHNIRHSLCRDLGFGIDESVEYLRRVGEVAKLFADAGVICITSIESPYKKDREACRALLPRGRFIEVFMDVPLQPCEDRSPKGLCTVSCAGKTKGFTGIDDLYEPPLSCEIILKHQGSSQSLSEMTEAVVSYLVDHGYLNAMELSYGSGCEINDARGGSFLDIVEAKISKMPQICYASESLEKLHQYMGYWYLKSDLVGVMVSQEKYCIPVPNQVVLATYPKCGTTWFKALIFSILRRDDVDYDCHPLLYSSPHDCAKWLEFYAARHPDDPVPPAEVSILSTHMAYDALPNSIKSCDKPIIYVSRNPKDTFVSLWHFLNRMRPQSLPPVGIREAFDCFCEGVSHYGPFWDHSLSYWYASLKEPQKVLFMKYEDMQSSPEESLKLLAHFVGHPFTKEEEENGALEKVIRLCSFDNMSTLEVNRGDETKPIGAQFTVANSMFFRKGKVGDYKAHLTPDMIERLEAITLKRCEGSGLMLL